MADRLVTCVRLGGERPGLPKPPFSGALGQRIFDSVSAEAWKQWEGRSDTLMAERKLNMGNPEHRKLLLKEMEDFFFGSGATAAAAAPVPPGTRMVDCAKIGRRLPGLDKPPFKGALGDRIFQSISKEGWKLWESQATIIMNHYGLSMADPEARAFLLKQMEEFFFGEGAKLPEDWVPPTAGGKGGGGGKGAPSPRRK